MEQKNVDSEDRDQAHACGRIRCAVCDPHVFCSVLGLVGTRPPHDLSTIFQQATSSHNWQESLKDAWPTSRVQPMTWIGAVSWGDPVGKRCKVCGSTTWQHHASSSSKFYHRETMVLSQSSAADQAHLRSHSGPCAGSLFHGSPTQLGYRTLLLEKMKLPLQIAESRCECGSQLDKLGRQRGACRRSGCF